MTLTEQIDLRAARKAEMGKAVNAHCPYDEATLRVSLKAPGKLICPCCWTLLEPPEQPQ
jgi:hypothetical protein